MNQARRNLLKACATTPLMRAGLSLHGCAHESDIEPLQTEKTSCLRFKNVVTKATDLLLNA